MADLYRYTLPVDNKTEIVVWPHGNGQMELGFQEKGNPDGWHSVSLLPHQTAALRDMLHAAQTQRSKKA